MCGAILEAETSSDSPREAGDLDSLDDETDVAASAAAAVNRPPVGTHEADGEPLVDADLLREYLTVD